MTRPDPEFWHRLASAELPGRTSREILADLGSFSGTASDFLTSCERLTDSQRTRVRNARLEPLYSAMDAGMRILEPDEYPEILLDTPNPPLPLFLNGDPAALDAPCVGIVGTRGASTYGRACARKFAEALGRAGITVVSGGALGIDGAAHQGALNAGGRTIAVLGNGVDIRYPYAHGALFEDIRQSGALVSQYPAGMTARSDTFVTRNWLIAALCQVLIVIEAPQKSGALYTASAAADMGRDVMVVPANIDNTRFLGSFGLLAEGATLCYHPDQVIDLLGLEAVAQPALPHLTDGLPARIMATLTVDPQPVEKLVAALSVDTADLLAELTMLELDGRVIREGAGFAKSP